jgi:predicted small lipoprotein YifL
MAAMVVRLLVLLVVSVVALVSCGGEGPARLPDAPAPPPVEEGRCDGRWFDSAFEVEVSIRLGTRELDPGRLARMRIEDVELVERAQICLDEVIEQAASGDTARRGLAFGLLVQGRLNSEDWLRVYTGYRTRRLTPCLRKNQGHGPEAARRCAERMDAQRPDLVVVRTCEMLDKAARATGPGFGREVTHQILQTGLSGHALRACLGIVLDRMWESDAALIHVLDELGGKPNEARLLTHFERMGPKLLERFAQMARAEDRVAKRDPSRRAHGCWATFLYWRLVQQGRLLFEGEMEDVEMAPSLTCVEQMGMLLHRAAAP